MLVEIYLKEKQGERKKNTEEILSSIRPDA